MCLSPTRSLAQDDDDSFAEDAREASGREDTQEANALSEGEEIEADDESSTGDDSIDEADLDARLVALDAYLGDLQKPSRMYFYSWVGIQTALTAGQALLATTYEKGSADRGSYLIGASLSGASLAMLLVGSYPGIYAAKRLRAMPQGTRAQKEAKALAGEKWLLGQAKADALSTSVIRHVLGGVFAVGSGLGVALGYDHSVKAAVTRTLTVLLVSELQIVTRPVRSIQYAKRYGSDPSAAPQLAIAPMIDRYAQGVSVVGQF